MAAVKNAIAGEGSLHYFLIGHRVEINDKRVEIVDQRVDPLYKCV